MDLNVGPSPIQQQQQQQPHSTMTASTTTTAASAAAAPLVGAGPTVPGHRRTLRQRAERLPVTNRRTISRPRKHTQSTGCNIFAYPYPSTYHPSTDALPPGGVFVDYDYEDSLRPPGPLPKATIKVRGGGPTAKEIARFYMNANKSARVKSTCLETIQECSDEDPDTLDGPLGQHVNFLSVRKLRRSLTFAATQASSAHTPHQQRRATCKLLAQRRRRRIKEKLGGGGGDGGAGAPTKPAKFSMQVFMDKMHALHEEADRMELATTVATGSTGGAAAAAKPGTTMGEPSTSVAAASVASSSAGI